MVLLRLGNLLGDRTERVGRWCKETEAMVLAGAEGMGVGPLSFVMVKQLILVSIEDSSPTIPRN